MAIVFIDKLPTASTWYNLFSYGYWISTSNCSGIGLQVNANTTQATIVLNAYASNTQTANTSGVISVGVPHVCIATFNPANGHAVYVDGVKLGTMATSVIPADNTVFYQMLSQTANGATGVSYGGAQWNRCLSEREIRELSANPYLFLTWEGKP
jgi:hypothetical protein